MNAASRWQKRRMIITRTGVYFTLVDQNHVRDSIPLQDVTSVAIKMDNENFGSEDGDVAPARNEEAQSNSSKREASVEPKASAFQIETSNEGYNSGRIYYIQAASPDICSSIVSMLKQYYQSAKAVALKRSEFEKSQQLTLGIYQSSWFQTVVTALILTVSFAAPQTRSA